MSDMLSRVAGAPITWGADASAGWGYLMDPARVMSEMREAGLSATELGPDGFLPSDPQELKDFVAGYDMSMVGGFVPAILYRDKDMDADVQYFERASDQLAAAGASNVVLGPRSHYDGYDTEIDMDDDQWAVFLRNLRRFQDITEERGLQTALHPHWGMAISRQNQVDRLLNSCDVGMCVDAGHLFLSGVDPLQVVKDAGDRVLHVHIKDLTNEMAEQVRSGEVPFRQATIDGMFVPAGSGDQAHRHIRRCLGVSGSGLQVVRPGIEGDSGIHLEPPVANDIAFLDVGEVAIIRHTIEVAVLDQAVFDCAVVGNAVGITVDVQAVRNAVGVAVRIAFVGNHVSVEVVTKFAGDAVSTAVLPLAALGIDDLIGNISVDRGIDHHWFRGAVESVGGKSATNLLGGVVSDDTS